MKNALLCLLTVFILCTYSCRTDKCKNSKCANINKIDSEFARYWDFKEGSYWIYQLANDTNEVDTVNLNYTSNGINDDCPPALNPTAPACTEFAVSRLNHSNGKFFPSITSEFGGYIEYSTNASYNKTLRFISSHQGYSGTDGLRFVQNNTINAEMTMRDSNLISVKGITYTKTAHLTTNMDTTIHKKIYLDQWWVKDVGLVKFVLSGDLVWELKQYHIEN